MKTRHDFIFSMYLIPIKYTLTRVIGMAMAVALTLEGRLERVVEMLMKEGYATSKAEVVRMGLMRLEEELHTRETEGKGIGSFIAKNSNKDIWEDSKEDKVWNKY